MSTITAFGQTYTTYAAAQDRVRALVSDNAKYGASDDRVTEINALNEAMAEHAAARTAAAAPPVYRVLYRTPTGRKGARTFKSEAARSRWMWSDAARDYAITGY